MVDAKAMNWTMLNIPSEGITHAEPLAKVRLTPQCIWVTTYLQNQ